MSRVFAFVLPVAAIAGVAAYVLHFGESRPDKLDYETVAVERGLIRRIVSTSGPVRALVTVSVGSQLSGQIDTVGVDFNSEVKPGDILAVLDRRTFAARTAQAEADLASAEAALINQKASRTKAEAVLRNAERTIERQRSLAAKGFSAQATLDTAIRDQDVAKAEIAVADALISSAKATIAQRKAALDSARIDLERSEIRSPISGTVISRTVDPGQTVAASLQAPELFKIAQDLSRIRIEAQVNEADVGSVAEGNPVTFSVDAYPDREFEGKVTQVRLAATEINNVVTYTVIIEAMNEDRRLFPGMTANVRIESARREGALRISNDALRFRPRDAQAGGARTGSEAQQRSERTIDRLTNDLALTPDQVAKLRAELDALSAEMKAAPTSGLAAPAFDPAAFRQKLILRIDAALSGTLSAEQVKLYERWKKGREGTRIVAMWAIGPDGAPERRMVRVGLADDQFTEILSPEVKEADRFIVRAREAKK